MTSLYKRNYICVHCGAPMKYLFKQYSPTVLKLMNCDSCDRVADKYLEHDEVVILIDIILFNQEAYRHILFNTEFKNHWKFALLILIVKTSDEWLCLKSLVNNSECLAKKTYENIIYFSIFTTVLGKALFFWIVLLFLTLFCKLPSSRNGFLHEVKLIWKAIICSTYGYLLLLPSLIWSDFQREFHLIFITVYTLMSQIQALTVVFKIQRPLLAGILLLADIVEYGFCNLLRWSFQLSVL